MTSILVLPDGHAHYEHSNERAEYIGEYIRDSRPDIVVDLGDVFDMPSLASFDKGRAAFQGRSYAKDIEAGNEYLDRLWSTVKKSKRKLPRRVFLVGNHEQRIDRAIDQQPELKGVLGYGDLQLDRYYDEVVHYNGNTPGTIEIEGIHFAHYFVSGVMGRAIGGEHIGYSLISKGFASSTQGHTHTLDYCIRTAAGGKRVQGLVAGCLVDYPSSWAGESQKLWWSGVIMKRNVEDGQYDPEFVSLNSLKAAYGTSKK